MMSLLTMAKQIKEEELNNMIEAEVIHEYFTEDEWFDHVLGCV